MNSLRSTELTPSAFTFLEVLTALSVLALLFAGAFPLLKRELDRLAALGAREEVAGIFHLARTSAIAHGGSQVRLQRTPPSVELAIGAMTIQRVDLAGKYGAALLLSRNRDEAELRFDALGLGRLASQTLTISRGGTRVRLLVSAYGRVRKE